MKKSEKIEIRVTHEEKERLSRLADARGQTISDVVRDGLVELGGMPARAKASPLVGAALALGVLGTGLGGAALMTEPEAALVEGRPVFMTADTLSFGVFELNDRIFTTTVPLTDGTRRSYEFETDSGIVRAQLTLAGSTSDDSADRLMRADIEACIIEGEACRALTVPAVEFAVTNSQTDAQTKAELGGEAWPLDFRMYTRPTVETAS